jgi:hypothetical protein
MRGGLVWISGLQQFMWGIPSKSVRAYRPWLDDVLIDARCVKRYRAKYKKARG